MERNFPRGPLHPTEVGPGEPVEFVPVQVAVTVGVVPPQYSLLAFLYPWQLLATARLLVQPFPQHRHRGPKLCSVQLAVPFAPVLVIVVEHTALVEHLIDDGGKLLREDEVDPHLAQGLDVPRVLYRLNLVVHCLVVYHLLFHPLNSGDHVLDLGAHVLEQFCHGVVVVVGWVFFMRSPDGLLTRRGCLVDRGALHFGGMLPTHHPPCQKAAKRVEDLGL